ncbi:MAG: DUF5309 family protein [Alphaproteobacteria bacterium]
MPTMVTGQTTFDHPSNYIKIDVFDRIATYDPEATPLLALLTKLNKQRCHDTVVRWFEDELVPRWGLTSATTQAVTASGTIDMAAAADASVFDTGGGAGTLGYNPATGEQFLVTTTSSAQLTASRGWGDVSTSATITVNSSLLCLGRLGVEFALSVTPRLTQPAAKTNVTQIFKDPITFSGSEMETDKWVTNDREYKLKKLGRDHAVNIERSLWLASKKTASDNSSVRTMDGIIRLVTTNVTSLTQALTQDDLDSTLTMMARHTQGQNRNVFFFGSGKFVQAVNKFARSTLQVTPARDSEFGFRYVTYIGPHFDVKLVSHWLFENSGLTTVNYALERMAFAINLDFVMYRPLGKRDTVLRMNVQENDRDGEKHEYLTEATLQFMLQKAHAKITSSANFI